MSSVLMHEKGAKVSTLPDAGWRTTSLLCGSRTLKTHIQLDVHQDPQLLSCKAVQLSISPRWTSWGSYPSVSPVWPGPPGWQHNLLVYQSEFCVIFKLTQGAPCSMIQIINEVVKWDQIHTDPSGTPQVTLFQQDFAPLTMDPDSQTLFYPPPSLLIQIHSSTAFL